MLIMFIYLNMFYIYLILAFYNFSILAAKAKPTAKAKVLEERMAKLFCQHIIEVNVTMLGQGFKDLISLSHTDTSERSRACPS